MIKTLEKGIQVAYKKGIQRKHLCFLLKQKV